MGKSRLQHCPLQPNCSTRRICTSQVNNIHQLSHQLQPIVTYLQFPSSSRFRLDSVWMNSGCSTMASRRPMHLKRVRHDSASPMSRTLPSTCLACHSRHSNSKAWVGHAAGVQRQQQQAQLQWQLKSLQLRDEERHSLQNKL